MPFQVTRFAITLFLASTALLLSNVGAVEIMTTMAECSSCLRANDQVCRSRYDPNASFCCDRKRKGDNCTSDPD